MGVDPSPTVSARTLPAPLVLPSPPLQTLPLPPVPPPTPAPPPAPPPTPPHLPGLPRLRVHVPPRQQPPAPPHLPAPPHPPVHIRSPHPSRLHQLAPLRPLPP